MYQALYRKWRPQTFDEVVGQEQVTKTLKNQVKTGRFSHAYLFIGTRGTGKTTCARILARAVNCEHPVDGNPCGVCPACRGILEGSVLDVVELDAASNNGVDNVRALREEAVFSPTSVRKRVYIIDEVHMLSLQAFNALLKILEEPPEHLMFILATTELQKVPATILSRCQRHSFRRIDGEQLARYLGEIARREGFRLTEDAAAMIARLADGGVRDALSLLDQCSAAEIIDVDAVYSAMGLAGNRRVAELLDHILRHQVPEALEEFSGMWMDGKDPASLLNELSGLLRDVLMTRVAPRSAGQLLSGSFDDATLQAFAKRMTTEELLCALDTVQAAQAGLRDTKNPRIGVELCLVKLCDNTAGESVGQLRARISRLEEQIAGGLPVQRAAVPVSAEPAWDEEEDCLPPPRREEPPEEDELDPEQFREEQPEDAIVKREELPPPVRESAPEEVAAPSTDLPQPTEIPDLWARVCERVRDKLIIGLRVKLTDAGSLRGVLEGDSFILYAEPNFMLRALNKPEYLDAFSEAARAVTGRQLRVQLKPMEQQERPRRDLEELKSFKEVHFV